MKIIFHGVMITNFQFTKGKIQFTKGCQIFVY